MSCNCLGRIHKYDYIGFQKASRSQVSLSSGCGGRERKLSDFTISSSVFTGVSIVRQISRIATTKTGLCEVTQRHINTLKGLLAKNGSHWPLPRSGSLSNQSKTSSSTSPYMDYNKTETRSRTVRCITMVKYMRSFCSLESLMCQSSLCFDLVGQNLPEHNSTPK